MTQIWAHRGASGYCPENTMAAFKKAIELNSDGIELDVQLSKDGQVVVCHDEMIDRVSNGKGFIKDYSYQQLKQFNFNNKMDDDYPFCQIVLLEEVLQLLQPTDLMLNIELKTSVFHYDGIEQKVIDLVNKYQLQNRIIYSSFNHQSIVNILSINPKADCGFLHTDGIIDICQYANKYHVSNLHPAFYYLLDNEYVSNAREYDLKINSFTINEPQYIQAALALNINAIITNYPDLAIKIRNEKQRISI
ncbi:MAG: glycerophosphodiester phosphodiesterase [Erysipelotrichaceae bacterium]